MVGKEAVLLACYIGIAVVNTESSLYDLYQDSPRADALASGRYNLIKKNQKKK